MQHLQRPAIRGLADIEAVESLPYAQWAQATSTYDLLRRALRAAVAELPVGVEFE